MDSGGTVKWRELAQWINGNGPLPTDSMGTVLFGTWPYVAGKIHLGLMPYDYMVGTSNQSVPE